jgi:DNA-binding MarR family transcriptional regulator
VVADAAVDGAELGAEYLGFARVAVAVAEERLPDLDPVAMQAVLLLHRVSNAVVGDLEARVHRPAGWSFPGFRLLFALWVAGPLGVSRLAELSGVSRAAISTLSQRMERDGLVRRDPSETDARGVTLSLTDSGRDRLTRTFAEHNRRERHWVERLDPAERTELVRLLDKLGSGR